jgi:hypothetical protein
LEEAVADLPGTPILEAILRQLGGSPEEDALRRT